MHKASLVRKKETPLGSFARRNARPAFRRQRTKNFLHRVPRKVFALHRR
jgi:hypothetical protein